MTNDKVQEIIDNFSKQEDESPTSEISPATSNIYDETAKWGETYYYDGEIDDWGTPYEDDDRGYYLNLNT